MMQSSSIVIPWIWICLPEAGLTRVDLTGAQHKASSYAIKQVRASQLDTSWYGRERSPSRCSAYIYLTHGMHDRGTDSKAESIFSLSTSSYIAAERKKKSIQHTLRHPDQQHTLHPGAVSSQRYVRHSK
jgi:hypothetical protein